MTRQLPALSLFFAAIMWGLLWYPLQIFSNAGLSGLWATQIMYLVASVTALFFMRGRWSEIQHFPGKLTAIALASGWCNAAFMVAIAVKEPSRIVLLFYLSPVWAIMLGVIILKERPAPGTLYVCILALLGAFMMLWDPEKGNPWPRDLYDWLALSSGFAFAVSNLISRDLQQVSIYTKSFATWTGGVVVAALWLGLSSAGLPVTSVSIISLCVLVGIVGIVVMTLAVQFGVSRLPLYVSSIILLFEVVVTVVSEHLIKKQSLDAMGWSGAVLILSASLLFAFFQNKQRTT